MQKTATDEEACVRQRWSSMSCNLRKKKEEYQKKKFY